MDWQREWQMDQLMGAWWRWMDGEHWGLFWLRGCQKSLFPLLFLWFWSSVLCNIYRRRSTFKRSNTLLETWTVITFLSPFPSRKSHKFLDICACWSMRWDDWHQQRVRDGSQCFSVLLTCPLVKFQTYTHTHIPASIYLTSTPLRYESTDATYASSHSTSLSHIHKATLFNSLPSNSPHFW